MDTLVQQYKSIELASKSVVGHVTEIACTAVAQKGICTIGLAGGRTPQLAYRLLGDQIKTELSNWKDCHFFWGDERWVAPTDPDSNYFMAHEQLLSRAQISPQNIHPVPTEHKTPETGAEIYEKHLRDFFHDHFQADKNILQKDIFPNFDLIILGMGSDGHTASLFPGSGYLSEKTKWVTAVQEGVGSPPVARITLTLPVLNHARNIIFLISGEKKRKLLDTFINNPEKSAESKYPAAHVNPAGKLIWIISEEA